MKTAMFSAFDATSSIFYLHFKAHSMNSVNQ